ncbi:MAG: hypothetical protein H7239_12025 [Flavobacterium sp.]|nr:hypothetical protein [Flavobacterium sp.]
MNKSFQITVFTLLVVILSSFAIHKFYVSIYQINYVPKKQMIQITARIFVDDINDALEKKYHKKTFLGSEKEIPKDAILLKNYLSEKLLLKVNGTVKPTIYLSEEMEANVLICYLKIQNIAKLSSLSVENNALMELNNDQQNIIQYQESGEKKTLLLTTDNSKGILK